MNTNLFWLLFTFVLCAATLAAPGRAQPKQTPSSKSEPSDSWGVAPKPTTKPGEFVRGAPGKEKKPKHDKSGSGGMVMAMAVNPDPNGTGIVYSPWADNPDADVAVRNLAENLGNDPVRMYEWMRNNVRTEFYFGAHRGAYLTMLERAGNDIDQCALLGALFKAAGFTPAYRLEVVSLPRTATGANQVGAYEWLGVDDDAGALSILSDYLPSVSAGGLIQFEQMWVSINIPGRGETKFAPAIKPHSVGRQPDLDALSGYTWNDVAVASGSGSTGAYSGPVSQANIRNYFTGRSVAASDAIRTSGTLHDLSGAELARLPLIVPEVVTITAPSAASYPATVVFPDNAQTLALSGIPETYCGRFRVKVGLAESWFEATSLLGRPLAVEFDGNGDGIIRHNGVETTRDTSGNSSGTVAIELTFEPASAYFGSTAPQYKRTETVARQNTVAVIYSSGRSVDRLQKLLREVSAKEAANPANVTSGDRLQVIGHQYVSQTNELVALGTSYLRHDARWHYLAGMVYEASGRPIVSMGIGLVGVHARSASAPATDKVFRAASLLMGAIEGTAIEQHSGNKSFGTASLFDQAMTLGHGAHYLTSVGQLNSAGIANYSDTYLGSGGTAAIQAHLNAGGHVVLLSNSQVTANGISFGGWLKVNPTTGTVGSFIGSAKGGVTTGGVGTPSFISKLWTSAVRFVKTVFSQPPSKSSDPVDLATGSFYKEDTDLVVGNEGEPNGLRLERHYSSARAFADPTGLGRGFTHNYNIKLDLSSPVDLDAQRASCDEVLPLLLAIRHAQDTLNFEPQAARSWLMSSSALTWAMNRQINTRVTIALGANNVEFVRRPNSSFAPTSNLTATLTEQGDGSHDLAFRHGNTIHFRTGDGKFDTITDQFGRTLSAGYDGNGRLQQVTDAYGRYFTFAYDGSGRLTGVSDSTGRSVAYGRDGAGNFTFTDAEGKTQTLEWNSDYLLTRVKDARGRTIVENDYDFWQRVWRQRTFGEAGRTTQIRITPGYGTEVDPAGGAVHTYFDARGRKIFVLDQTNKLLQWQYDGVDRLTKTISPKSEQHSFGYDAAHVLVSETNEASHTHTIEPDAQHRPWKVRNYEGQETVITYTVQHKVETITAPGGLVTSFQYDGVGRLWKHHPASYAANEFLTYAYDSYGNINTLAYPGGGSVACTFDTLGNLQQLIDRNAARTSFTYNARRQRTSATQWEGATQRTSQTFYDDAGDVSYTLDASGRKVGTEHDALGHLTQVMRGPIASPVVTLTNSYSDPRTLLTTTTDANNNSVAYTYYATQQLATVQDPLLRTTTFGYDEDRRHTTTQTPLGFINTEIWDSRSFKDGVQDAENQLTDYTYDKDGRLTVLANRLNKPFGWSYDDANRTAISTTPTGKTTTAVANTRGLPVSLQKPSTQSTTFDTYDSEGRLTQKTDSVGTTTFTYWPNGLPKDVTENGHTTHREYDALNRLSQYQDGEGNTIFYGYFPSGELATITYPGNKTVTYGYDDFGRLRTVTDWASRTTTYTYDNASRLTRIDRPNGTYRIQDYDAASQLTLIREYISSGAFITRQELRYDADGRIIYNFIHPKPAAVILAQDDLLYDDDNRLSTWNSQSVVFDADGNMTNGPLPSGTLGAYGYDARNRLTSAGGSGYRYSPDGLRVEITGAGAATFVIDPNAALSRTLMRTKGGTTTYYVYGLGLLYEETGGAPKFYHADQVGSTLTLTDSGQTVTDTWSYAPYGAIASRTGSTDTPFQFNGELGVQTDANGLLHMRARYYNPRLMRFCNADPIGFGGGLNYYAFVGNNPISFTDPFGLERLNSNGGAVTASDIVAQIGALGQLAGELDQSRSFLARLFSSNPYRAEAQQLIQLLNAVGAGITTYNATAAPGTQIDGATFNFASPDTANLARLGTGAQQAALLLANYAAVATRSAGSVLAKAVNADGSLNTSITVARQLAVGGARSWIPTESILSTMRNGIRVADPQGVAGQYMYRAPFSFTRWDSASQGSKTSSGTLEVLVHEPTGQIRHVLYRSGP